METAFVPGFVVVYVVIYSYLQVYTVGPDYAHAEARKSPALDGKVERDAAGKEVRYPVILSNREKLIARKVCMAFKQVIVFHQDLMGRNNIKFSDLILTKYFCALIIQSFSC